MEEIKWYWITPGSVLGLVLWLLISFAFRAYLGLFDTYSATYGSLGAVSAEVNERLHRAVTRV